MWVEGESQPSSAQPRRRGLRESRLFRPGVTQGGYGERMKGGSAGLAWEQTFDLYEAETVPKGSSA